MATGDKCCPQCGSEDILPFESEEDYKEDYSPAVVLLSALLVITGYLFFVVSSYLYFPMFIFIFIIFAAILINRREKQRKRAEAIEKDYICLECDNNFKL